MGPRLKDYYNEQVVQEMKKEFKYKSVMQVPRIVKIVINMGLGEAINDAKLLENMTKDLVSIAGQKPVITKSKKAISNFHLREGNSIGTRVTLRRDRMWEFYDRFVNFALPRTKDFRGLSPKGFDGHGNYTVGIKEHIIFPEIDYDKVYKIKGMNITVVTTAKTDEEAKILLDKLGMPFRKN